FGGSGERRSSGATSRGVTPEPSPSHHNLHHHHHLPIPPIFHHTRHSSTAGNGGGNTASPTEHANMADNGTAGQSPVLNNSNNPTGGHSGNLSNSMLNSAPSSGFNTGLNIGTNAALSGSGSAGPSSPRPQTPNSVSGGGMDSSRKSSTASKFSLGKIRHKMF
ncbi:hypothetical protein BJ085DRAFT_39559, partial [Dimargaris cristalligena]